MIIILLGAQAGLTGGGDFGGSFDDIQAPSNMDYPLYPQLTNGQNDQYLQYQDPLQEDSFGQLSDTNLESKTSYEIPYLSTQPLGRGRSKEQITPGLQNTNTLLTSVNGKTGMKVTYIKCYQLQSDTRYLVLTSSFCFYVAGDAMNIAIPRGAKSISIQFLAER